MTCFAIFMMLIVSISTLTVPTPANLQVSLLKTQIQSAFQIAKKLGSVLPLNITKTLISSDSELKMNFYYMPGLLQKLKQGESRQLGKNYSDDPFINIEQGLFVRDFGATHSLMFNKYNIYDKHMVIVTKEFQLQISRITLEDMNYAAITTQALNGILYFNGGKISGASQLHKHLQVLPEEGRNLPIIEQLLKQVQSRKQQKNINKSKIFKFPNFHFLHGIITFKSTPSSLGSHLFSAYQDLYEHLIEKNRRFKGTETGYNIIGSESFLMMILRRQQKAFGVSVNALGYMGSVLFQEGEEMESYYEQHSPTDILQEISFK